MCQPASSLYPLLYPSPSVLLAAQATSHQVDSATADGCVALPRAVPSLGRDGGRAQLVAGGRPRPGRRGSPAQGEGREGGAETPGEGDPRSHRQGLRSRLCASGKVLVSWQKEFRKETHTHTQTHARTHIHTRALALLCPQFWAITSSKPSTTPTTPLPTPTDEGSRPPLNHQLPPPQPTAPCPQPGPASPSLCSCRRGRCGGGGAGLQGPPGPTSHLLHASKSSLP